MMQQTGRFTFSKTYRQDLIQKDCPIYVHCSRLCSDDRTGGRFLQVRLVNRSDKAVENVVLTVKGIDGCGNACGQLSGLILPDCKAQPHSIFGEDRMIAVGKLRAQKAELMVERVSFADGMIWRRRTASEPVALKGSDWKLCECGLPNPPGNCRCDLCGRAQEKGAEPVSEQCAEQTPETGVRAALSREEQPFLRQQEAEELPEGKPAPVMRSEQELAQRAVMLDAYLDEAETEEEDGVPRWLFVILCVIGGIALLAAVAFLLYFLKTTAVF